MDITIFTPTYNRAYILNKLYYSLCLQTYKDFEWLIVDDGSEDGTESLIEGFINENKIQIKYQKQQNAGKHIAINTGVGLAKGSLFFIVDSDDTLRSDAIEILYNNYLTIKANSRFAGVSGVRCTSDGKKIGNPINWKSLDCTSDELRHKYHVTGDMAEAWKTEVLKKFPFPVIEGEKFCSEVLVWSRIARKYKLRYFSDKIYVCDYLQDGLSHYTISHRVQSPLYALTVYSEMSSNHNLPIFIRVRAMINGWRFGLRLPNSRLRTCYKYLGVRSVFFIPLSIIMLFKDCFYIRKVK